MSPDAQSALCRATDRPSPALSLLRTLRREGLFFRAKLVEKRRGEHDNGWRYDWDGNTALIEEHGQYRAAWVDHKEAVKMYLRNEWVLHTFSGVPYCTCGAVGDTAEGYRQMRGEPFDYTDPTLRQCITCNPEIEEALYGTHQHA